MLQVLTQPYTRDGMGAAVFALGVIHQVPRAVKIAVKHFKGEYRQPWGMGGPWVLSWQPESILRSIPFYLFSQISREAVYRLQAVQISHLAYALHETEFKGIGKDGYEWDDLADKLEKVRLTVFLRSLLRCLSHSLLLAELRLPRAAPLKVLSSSARG
jgi:hypothetical protein